MHQPDYRNEEGIMQMPWVFLHAIKDYYDMPWMMSRYSSIKATFNITAPLIEQLKLYYTNPQSSDKFLKLWADKPINLQENEKEWLVKICQSTQFDTMVKTLPRYAELFYQKSFTDAELLDLEVCFLLSWCGVYLRTNNTFVQTLFKKERDFSEEDKIALLKELANFICGIWDFYKKLHDEKRITIATTPFYHPILPLLMDMKNAQKANPKTVIPKEYITLEDDAILHIKKAQKLFKETFGYEVKGFWPAEGAVDESSVALLKSLGITWIATDEEILYKSINSRSKNLLYSPYNHNDMIIGFRDHYLSDLIGFHYRYEEAEDASNNFMAELQKIQNIKNNNTAFVILDGENAWEFYKNNGYDFFDALYKQIEESDDCHTLTMDEVKQLPSRELIRLEPGSWINGCFDTWVGNTEKTRAWELLFLTKKDYTHHKDALPYETQEKIATHFLEAECSDWFWWYGDDHFTEFDVEFDTLFRHHLIDIYTLMGIIPPGDLFSPIIKHQSNGKIWLQPQSQITPTINGKKDSVFEWMGCGIVDESKAFSTMDSTRGPIKKIYYGQDDEKLYFAFEGEMSTLCRNGFITIIIDPLHLSQRVAFKQTRTSIGEISVTLACDKRLEFSVEKAKININDIAFRFEIEEEDKALQTLPSFGELRLALDDNYLQNWFV
jgi:alpha-amylase/alpha-mannosidase (GH57 family)